MQRVGSGARGEEYFIAGTEPQSSCIRERSFTRTAGNNTPPSPTVSATPPDVATAPTNPPQPNTGGPQELLLEQGNSNGSPFDEKAMREEIKEMQKEMRKSEEDD